MPPKSNINARTITAPLAAFCMAAILFVYSRTSILAAKRNAQKHREADGGQLNWHKESLRRHGKIESPVQEGTLGQLFATLQDQQGQKKATPNHETRQASKADQGQRDRTAAEKGLREMTGVGTQGQ
ncbi:hypothetical protein OnM2_043017 [Erysiphe neolycopersici]|uniref:Uncharacterized protein n=1 Tax=Erysiphe neolycopersici TaxID=212602 RepID=A0A420HV31_9PEZI|nr:hypothetical protein OnM2_043017 [Erysiphe neolycopersici]